MIPTSLDECFAELDRMLGKIDLNYIMDGTSDDVMIIFHDNLGRYIRNTWGLWDGIAAVQAGREPEELYKYFNNMGISHPDDCSGIILKSYWRHKHNVPLDLEAQVKHYQDYWAEQAKEEALDFPV
jgi:hypothetical protein